MRTLDLALKDIRQILRDKQSLIFLLVMPVVFTFFFGFAFSSSADSGEADTRLAVGVRNRDADGPLAGLLLAMLEESDTLRPVMVDEAGLPALDGQIVNGDLAAGLVIPPGFSAAMLDGGEGPQLELIINEETDDGQTVRRAMQTLITRVLGLAQSARSSLKAYESAAGPLPGEAERQAYLQDALERGAQSWKSAPVGLRTASAAVPVGSDGSLTANPYNQFSPGMIVQFAFFGLVQAAMVLVVERKHGAMARLLTTPMRKAELIGGHLLAMFVVFFIQQALLIAFGQFVLKVDYLREPLAVLVVVTAVSLWVAASGLLIAALVKKEEQVVMFAMIGMFVFSALGGAWFSLEIVGETFAAIGHLMPSAWAIDGYQNIIARGLGLESVLLPAGVILAYAVAFFGISIWRFKYE